jgi:hypothetical protein
MMRESTKWFITCAFCAAIYLVTESLAWLLITCGWALAAWAARIGEDT